MLAPGGPQFFTPSGRVLTILTDFGFLNCSIADIAMAVSLHRKKNCRDGRKDQEPNLAPVSTRGCGSRPPNSSRT